MPFLSFSNINIYFAEISDFNWRNYTITEALTTTKTVELIDKKKFAKVALDEKAKAFVIHVAVLSALSIHPSRDVQFGLLLANETLNNVLPKYSDYADVFSPDLAIGLPKHIGINDYTIKLKKSKQLAHSPIYSLDPGELETFKTYIKTHLKTWLISSFTFPVGPLIFFE